jgi:hypothetical protein
MVLVYAESKWSEIGAAKKQNWPGISTSRGGNKQR